MTDYKWNPIRPLSEQDGVIDLAFIRPLYDSWRISEKRLKESSRDNLREFNNRLVRRLSIETGILERLYDLDRCTTEALIAMGFVEDIVSRSSTDIEPSRLIDILQDQEAAIQLVLDCIANKRPLTKSVLHELHILEGGPDHENSHWYKYEVVASAKDAGKFANFSEHHYFVKASIRAEREQLVFVVSFHHVGRELSGIIEVTAFAKLVSFEGSEDRHSVSDSFFVCSLEPFVFTHQTDVKFVEAAFTRWIDASLAIAVKEYGDRL